MVTGRLVDLMQALVRHLHAYVREVEPSMDEWFAAIQYLTDTGKMCDGLVRQEFILLSDTLGVSMLVDSDRTSQDLIKRADERLYEAKRGGRNRVVA